VNTPAAPDRESSFLPLVETMAAIFGGVTYGLGWLFSAGLTARLGVYPEEIGLTFSFIAVRTGVFVLAAVAVTAPALYITWNSAAARRFWESGADNESTLFNGAFLALQLALLAAFGVFIVTWRPWKYAFPADLLVSVAVAAVAFGFLATQYIGIAKARYGSGAEEQESSWRKRRRPLALLIVLLSSVFVCAVTWSSGGLVASQIKRGEAIDLRVIRSLPVVMELSGSNALPRSACYVYLGSSDGLEVLYEPSDDRVIRVAVENATLVREHQQDQCPKR
jgi:hypothetical protein